MASIGCSICWESFGKPNNEEITTPCRHVFHESCISKWILERKLNTCPECRSLVTLQNITRIYFNVQPSAEESNNQKHLISNTNDLRLMKSNFEKLEKTCKVQEAKLKENKSEIVKLRSEMSDIKASLDQLKESTRLSAQTHWRTQPSTPKVGHTAFNSSKSRPFGATIQQPKSKLFGELGINSGSSQKPVSQPSAYNFSLPDPWREGGSSFFNASNSTSQPSFGAAAKLPSSSFGAPHFNFTACSQASSSTAPSNSLFSLPSREASLELTQELTSKPQSSAAGFCFGPPQPVNSTPSQTEHALSANQATQHQASCLNEPIAEPLSAGLNTGQFGNANGQIVVPANKK